MSDHRSPPEPMFGTGWRHADERDCETVSRFVGAPTHHWEHGAVRVLSSAEQAEYRGIVVPHNHCSVSVYGEDRRPSDEEMAEVRHAFDMHDAEEDNHQPGRIRNLFLPLHLPRGTVGICDCKTDETVVTEPDGFQWSRKVDR